jgi:hypothetical protein
MQGCCYIDIEVEKTTKAYPRQMGRYLRARAEPPAQTPANHPFHFIAGWLH